MTGPKSFNVQTWLDMANQLVNADEVLMALKVLEMLPGYYRDNMPQDILNLKNEILSRVSTPSTYASNIHDLRVGPETADIYAQTLRGMLINKEIELLNKAEIMPHIYDYGPGEFALPIMLSRAGRSFTYTPIGLCAQALELAMPYIKNYLRTSPIDPSIEVTIFYAGEILEHLHYEAELKTEMLRTAAGLCDVVHISTPKYCCDNRVTNWMTERGELGHLRSYTPGEFRSSLISMFPEYATVFYDNEIQHCRLTYPATKSEHLRGLMEKNILDI